jgi:uncharacterized protein YegP (UPF0339 family)
MELLPLSIIVSGTGVMLLAIFYRWLVVGLIGLGVVILGGLLVVMTPEPAGDAYEWHRYEMGRGTFFVQFPMVPERESTATELEEHGIVHQRFILHLEGEDVTLVAVCLFSPDTGYTFSRDLSAKTNKLDRTEGFEYAREIEAKVPAVEFRNHNKAGNGQVMLSRIYHARFAALHLIASAPEDAVEHSLVERFLGSVEIPLVR